MEVHDQVVKVISRRREQKDTKTCEMITLQMNLSLGMLNFAGIPNEAGFICLHDGHDCSV